MDYFDIDPETTDEATAAERARVSAGFKKLTKALEALLKRPETYGPPVPNHIRFPGDFVTDGKGRWISRKLAKQLGVKDGDA